jgi:hypothetical protein
VAIDLPHLGDESQQMDCFGLGERIEQPVGHDKTRGLSPGFCPPVFVQDDRQQHIF